MNDLSKPLRGVHFTPSTNLRGLAFDNLLMTMTGAGSLEDSKRIRIYYNEKVVRLV